MVQPSSSEDGLCQVPAVRAGGVREQLERQALPLQLLVRLVLNEAAEHGEGSKWPVCGHHVASSL